MQYSTNDADYKGLLRYDTPLWKDLELIQNTPKYQDRDILTITGFMKTAQELIAHIARL